MTYLDDLTERDDGGGAMSRLGVCPDCGGSRLRTSARCDPCYRKRRVANHNQLRPMPLATSAPMAVWTQPPAVAPRPGGPLVRWRMNEWGEWVPAEWKPVYDAWNGG